MDSSPFTPDEKRFVLAEMIKSSTVDIDTLMEFVQANNISPNWMNMQLPHGRNMNQCIQVAEYISNLPTARKRQSTSSQGEPPSSHVGGATECPDQHLPSASPATKTTSPPKLKQLARIAPRPTNGTVEDHGQGQTLSSPPARPQPSRKRGRPSKADMAKRDLKPILPKYIAPRPPHQMPGYQMILPATSRPQDSPQAASPSATLITAQSTPSDDSREKKRRRTADSVP
ncbi:hypothetical protein TOPH_03121 [Tolypocladium ophioglossoides CBS 100239]|uniref:Uncharacterized protein n=1 Tax=Tolypocladium ophioglossoides (strain CBS 100239) TaxID=1163406 RepID=A0A0L0NEY6_TOLOC|nr:hypothetical protein TOPH_03121 [Tolypocladium ophioglossoides CBS 100239]